MIRDVERLGREVFDLLIVGGGVYGLATAREAAARGLSVALVERGDFGAASSYNHHKTLHGGLRYLQRGDLARMRESALERRAFARMAPQFVAPLAFAMPTRPSVARGRWALRAALAVDRVVAFDRHRGVPDELRLPRARVIGRQELLELVPELSDVPANGAALWYEYTTVESERLTLAFALAAARDGAALANYVEAVAPGREGTQITGMRVRDVATGAEHVIRARLTCNAAGASAGRIMAAFGVRRPFPLVKAMNLVTHRPAPAVAFSAATRSGRLLVALPWRGRLAVGTWHGSTVAGADDTHVAAGELDGFLLEINDAMPWLALRREDVSLVHRGLIPARVRRGQRLAFVERSRVYDHASQGVEGALSIVGVKYTTARRAAERAVDLARAKLGLGPLPSTTTGTPLVALPDAVPPAGLTEPLASELRLYDAEARERLVRLAAERPAERGALAPGAATTGVQVREAVRHEMALTLEDVILRRTSLGSVGYPGDAATNAAAHLMADELGWSGERVDAEVEAVRRYYELPRA